ncbi:RNA-directed DNA polymerase, eukaryota, reverse transcriptase zinc-binding domain protein [Tanacetum coccineum]
MEVQRLLDADPNNMSLKEKAVIIGKEYYDAADDELKLLHQKARVHWLKEGDKNSAYFHSILTTRKNKSRVESICKEDGTRVVEDKVSKQFVNHFKEFLGKSQPVQTLSNMEDYVQAKLTEEEALDMIKMVTDDEIKSALFDIDSSKAAGPDGFTSSLMPKFDTPDKVSAFRPIPCCNVLYKCISKILTNRIKDGLSKVVSLNQSAFIPGRHIQDNILISQDRLKVFNMIMIKNIDETHSFKYHYGCKELKLTRMCFADDLMVLCNGDKESLIFFGSLSEERKSELLEVLPFKCGKLSMRYLGVPLLSKKLGANDYKSLIDSLDKRINNWRSNLLSYARRMFKRFLWNSGRSAQWKDRVAWKLVCRPKEQGKSIWEIKSCQNDSWGWKFLMELRNKIRPYVKNKIGSGKGVSMWYDNWSNIGPLKDSKSARNLQEGHMRKDYVVWIEESKEGEYSVSSAWRPLFLGIAIHVYFLWNERNKRIFKDESRKSEELIKDIQRNMVDMIMSLKVKNSGAVEKAARNASEDAAASSFLDNHGVMVGELGELFEERLLSVLVFHCCSADAELSQMDWGLSNSISVLGVESNDHLFFSCDVALNIWRLVRIWLDVNIPMLNSHSDWESWVDNFRASSEVKLRMHVIVAIDGARK